MDKVTYRFGDITVDPQRRELIVGAESKHLDPQSFEVLVYLLEARDRVVSKEELMDAVWGDRFVSESAITSRIKSVRRALGDDGRAQRVVKTFHGVGYRLVAEVTAARVPGGLEAPSAADEDHGDQSPPRVAHLDQRPLVGNLPTRLPALVGRQRELDELLAGCRDADLVSIVGPGGAGKTALALEVGNRLAPTLDGSVVFCELAATASGRVADQLLDVLERTSGSVDTTSRRLASRLAEQPAVVLLDNCEHLIDECATLAEDLLELTSELTIVATSREPLAARSELIVRIGGLETGGEASAAVELFRDRAQRSGAPPWASDEETTVQHIVERVDGLPLAIELAAARLATMSPAQLLTGLENQMGMLTARRSRTERHSTMNDTIEWSYRLLSGEEQRTLQELSVFVSSFPADGAERVCSASWTMPILHRLVEQSVVTRVDVDRTTRFRLLEPVRQYVRSTIDPDVRVEVDRRHAEYLAAETLAIASGLASVDEGMFARKLSSQWRDLAAAVAWGRDNDRVDIAVEPLVALGFHLLWQLRTEAFQWLEAAVAVFGDEVAGRDDVKVLRAIGAWSAGELERADALLSTVTEEETPAVALARYKLLMSRDAYEQLPEHVEAFAAIAESSEEPIWATVAVALRTVERAILEPVGAESDAALAAARSLADASEPGSGRLWLLLGDLTMAFARHDRTATAALQRRMSNEARSVHAPWFEVTAGGLASTTGSADDSADQLEIGLRAIRTALEADDLVQLPVLFHAIVVGLEQLGSLEPAARLLGAISGLPGVGSTGRATAGFGQAQRALVDGLGDSRFQALAGSGRGLGPAEALALAAEAVDAARGKRPRQD